MAQLLISRMRSQIFLPLTIVGRAGVIILIHESWLEEKSLFYRKGIGGQCSVVKGRD